MFARLQHHDEPRPDLSRVLKWRVRGASPNCVRLPMVTYSIGGPPQTSPDPSQSHKHQSTHWASSELPRNVVERDREAAKCIHGTSKNIFRKHTQWPKGIASQLPIPTTSGRPFASHAGQTTLLRISEKVSKMHQNDVTASSYIFSICISFQLHPTSDKPWKQLSYHLRQTLRQNIAM